MKFFLNKHKSRSFLGSRYFFVIIGAVFIAILVIGSSFFPADSSQKIQSDNIYFGIFFTSCFVIALIIFLSKHRAVGEFDINDKGITFRKKVYLWNQLKRYHWLGEVHGEKIASRSANDTENLYEYADTMVARIRTRNFLFRRYINLEVDKERSDELACLLESRDIKRLPRWRRVVGI